jgi:uncharacterized protein YlxW (UPF0749 family)
MVVVAVRNPVSWSPANGRWMAVVVATVAAILTFGFVQQIRVEGLLAETQRVREGQALAYLVERDTVATSMLQARVQALSVRLRAVSPGNPNPGNLSQALTLAGLIPVSGPGVVVTLADSPAPSFPGEPVQMQLVHDQYVLHIVGLLMAHGATAISISGQRFVSSTAVFCSGPTIRVNGVTEGSPFTISAVGTPASMLNALEQDPEVQGWSYLVQIHYSQEQTVSVPAYSERTVFRYATPDPKAS